MATAYDQHDNAREALLSSKQGGAAVRGHGLGLWRHVTARRWCGWAVSAVFFLFDVGIRLSADVVNSDLRSTFGIDATGVSNIGAAFFYAYASMQLPAGWALELAAAPGQDLAHVLWVAKTWLTTNRDVAHCVPPEALSGGADDPVA